MVLPLVPAQRTPGPVPWPLPPVAPAEVQPRPQAVPWPWPSTTGSAVVVALPDLAAASASAARSAEAAATAATRLVPLVDLVGGCGEPVLAGVGAALMAALSARCLDAAGVLDEHARALADAVATYDAAERAAAADRG